MQEITHSHTSLTLKQNKKEQGSKHRNTKQTTTIPEQTELKQHDSPPLCKKKKCGKAARMAILQRTDHRPEFLSVSLKKKKGHHV